MPIPLITNDPNGVLADNKDMSFKLLKAATLQLHEKGLVVVVASPIVMRELSIIARNRQPGTANARDADVAAIPDNARRTRATKRLHYAKQLRRTIFASQTNAANLHNICNTTLSPDFFNDVITSPDMNLYLGMHYSRKGALPFTHRLAALSAWKPVRYMLSDPQDYDNLRMLPAGTPEPDGTQILKLVFDSFHLLAGPGAVHENQALDVAYNNNNLAMLELVCACSQNTNRPNNIYVEGAGRDMTLYALAKIAKVRRQGQRRYAGVLTYLAFVPGSNPVDYPLEGIVQTYGFRRLNVRYARNDANRGANTSQAIEHYYVLCDTYDAAGNVVERWEDRLAHRFPDPSNLCALDTYSGRPQCV
jgi:hypothetical protein